MANKNDLRVIKTRNILFNSLLELMKNKSFEDIKVSDICSKALINRTTFYSHYSDKYELFLDLISTLKEALLNDLSINKNTFNTKEYFINMLEILFNHLEEKNDIYYSILLSNKNSIVIDILLDVITKDVNNRIKDNLNINNKIPSDVITNFYVGAVVSLVIHSTRNNKKYTKEEIINYLNILLPNNINEL